MEPSCNECACRADQALCAISAEVIQQLDEMKEQTVLGKGTVLFEEGQSCRGAFLLCTGRARLSVSSETGKQLTVRVASAGEMIGLGASLSGEPYEFTAELLESAQVVFLKRRDLLRFLRENPAVCMEVVRRLSADLHGAYERVRAIGLSRPRGVHPHKGGSLAS